MAELKLTAKSVIDADINEQKILFMADDGNKIRKVNEARIPRRITSGKKENEHTKALHICHKSLVEQGG